MKGADHEARADEEHEGDPDLDDDQRVAGAVPLAALAVRAAAVAEIGVFAGTRVLEDRHAAEEEAGEERNDEGEEERRRVEADLAEARQPHRGHRDEELDRAVGEDEAEQAPEEADDQTLEEELEGDAPPAGAQ